MYFIATSSVGDWSRVRRTTNEEMDTPGRGRCSARTRAAIIRPQGAAKPSPGDSSLAPARGHGGELDRVETYRGTTVKVGLAEKVVQHGEEAYSTGEGAILVTPEAGVEAEVPLKPI
jgi:hypothetical protein